MDNEAGLVKRAGLTRADVEAASRLAAICNRLEGLDLKLNLSTDTPAAAGEITHVLYFESGALVGFCGIDPGDEPELCGMVHPDYRRRGIGRELLREAVAECKRNGAERVLVICEEGSRSGRAFVDAVGGRLDFAEYRMALDPQAYAPGKRAHIEPEIAVRRVGERDLDKIVRVRAAAFDETVEAAGERVLGDIDSPLCEFYLAEVDGHAAGTMKIFHMGETTGIYGFGVVPGQRGRGVGRQFLTEIIDSLMARGRNRIVLEVETGNLPAIRLYTSTGFRKTVVYGYYTLV